MRLLITGDLETWSIYYSNIVTSIAASPQCTLSESPYIYDSGDPEEIDMSQTCVKASYHAVCTFVISNCTTN